MDKFKTLDDYKDKKKQEEDKKKTNVYTGGEKSGLAVENPEDIHGILNKAEQKSGADIKPGEINCKITLYQNGFSVDNGLFRDYNTPENQEFMKELNKGRIPKELRSKYPNGLQIGLEDKREEKYVPPPPPKYVEFSGQGVSLSSSKPGVESKPMGDVNLNVQAPRVDDNKPKTTIQIRLHNGKTTQLTLNISDKVSRIFEFVKSVAPVNGLFQLTSGFPPKGLSNQNLTIEEADLIDSLVTQKI